MKIRLLYMIVLLFCSLGKSFPYNYDSIFIENVKSYVFKEFNVILDGEFYTTWAKDNEPEIVFWVSLPDKIQEPEEFRNSSYYISKIIETDYRKRGYSTFIYKAYATGKTYLSERFVSYPYEELSFITFHELLHNYIIQQKIHIPYEFVEAACDVVGNFGALKYAKINDKLSLTKVLQQTELNENIYQLFNYYIDSINQSKQPADVRDLCNRCNISLHKLLTKADDFQKDRFDYKVNNAYLLKNSNYCKEYFLLKRVFLKSGSIKNFLEIIRGMPLDTYFCIRYLEEYLNKFILSYHPACADASISIPDKDTGKFIFRLYSGSGKMVKQESFIANYYQFNCTDLLDGLYFYSLTGDKSNYSGKLLVQHE